MSQLSRGCHRHITALVVASIAYASHALAQVSPAGLQWGPLDSGNGPWAISTYDYDRQVTGSPNPVIYFGYNQAAGGFPFLAGEPGLSLGIEGNYLVNGTNKMEFYLQYIDGAGTVLRPLFFQFDRQTRALSNAWIGGAPVINFGSANDNTINAQISRNTLAVFGVDPTQGTNIHLRTAAGSGQSGQLHFGFDGNDNMLSIFPVNRTSAVLQINGTTGFQYYQRPMGGSAAGSIAVGGIDDNSAIGVFGSENASDNVSALVARGKATMHYDVFEVQAQDHSVVHGVDKTGVVYMAPAPAPGANPGNGVYLYVDQADNKLKYRDAAGVVHVILTSP
jgi:hypothetical protein